MEKEKGVGNIFCRLVMTSGANKDSRPLTIPRGWPVAQVAGELEILDDVRCQPVERVPAADYPRAGARSAPEFMRRLS